MTHSSSTSTISAALFLAFGNFAFSAEQARAQEQPAAASCLVSGRISSGETALPGASIVVFSGDERRGQTTSGVDGRYTLRLAPDAHYRLSIELAFFEGASREVITSAGACDQTIDVALSLQRRNGAATAASADGANQPPVDARDSHAGQQGAGERTRQAPQAPGTRPRFETLTVKAEDAPALSADAAAAGGESELQRLLPPGFSLQDASSDAVALNGSGDATQLDRRMMNDRLQLITRGDLDPATGGFSPGFDPGSLGGFGGGFGAQGGPGGPGGFGPGALGGGGPVFFIGGRGSRQNGYQGAATYSFGGSLLDTAPFQLRPEVPVTQPQFAKNTFGATLGGPFKIPGLYDNTERRSRFQMNYTGGRGNNVFSQYATVPTDAMRNGDFSASPFPLIDPLAGTPFANNQIPLDRMNDASLALLAYIPRANLPGTSQNYQLTTLAHSTTDDISLRFTQNLSPDAVQSAGAAGREFGGPGRGEFGRGFAAGPRGNDGPGRGAAPRPTSIVLNGQLQLRHGNTESPNVFESLATASSNTSIAVPLSLNIVKGRTVQNVNVNLTHSSSSSTNGFAGITDVSGLAGIQYPGTSADPLNWGIPNLSFGTLSGARLGAATTRSDNRLSIGYMWNRPFGRHQIRMGGDYRFDRSTGQNNGNARGSFLFTGLYTAPYAEVAGNTGADFADFLLGMPQQATLQAGGTTELHGQSFNAFLEDNWRRSSRLTFNLGVRYELVLPYTEIEGRLANLDVTPDFTAASAVIAGGAGPFTGQFPKGLLDADINNIGPRLGVAYRVANGTVLRGGYSLTYNNNSYAAIARQLSGQPPFAYTQTILGSAIDPLLFQTALLSSSSGTTNNWGVDRDYALGQIQTWNAALSRDISRNWSININYVGTKGTNLDILRAPNRDPDGLRIPGVQAFIWESSDGHSLMNSGTVQLRRRLASGFSASVSYTLAKSMDNASSLGAGGTVVAQNDQDLDAEWARSNFDRRHQFSTQGIWELPFGVDRRWLSEGGLLAAVFGNWNVSATYAYQSGLPFTPRVSGAASDAARGTSGSLRANYDGSAIALDSPTTAMFFNTAAFSVPAAGTFGNSPRNIITGPSSSQLNAVISRDLRLGGNRGLTLIFNATNLLNTVQWSTIDTNLNSATFGQVLAVRPMRTMTLNLRMRF